MEFVTKAQFEAANATLISMIKGLSEGAATIETKMDAGFAAIKAEFADLRSLLRERK